MDRATYLRALKGLYGAELQTHGALPVLVRYAAGEDLRLVLKNQRKVTQEKIKRFRKVFRDLKELPESQLSEPIKIILQEALLALQKNDKGHVVRDGVLLSRLQRVEHFLIESYEVAIMLAEMAKVNSDFLRVSLEESIVLDERLTQLVERNMERRFGRYRIARGTAEFQGRAEKRRQG